MPLDLESYSVSPFLFQKKKINLVLGTQFSGKTLVRYVQGLGIHTHTKPCNLVFIFSSFFGGAGCFFLFFQAFETGFLPGCPGTQYADKAGIELSNLSTSGGIFLK